MTLTRPYKIPREAPLSAVPIYVAFNQTGKGHYDAINVFQIEVDISPKIQSESSCRCGQGSDKNTEKTFCTDYSSRCKCFQKIQGCGNDCRCRNCNNPYGKRVTDEMLTISRKRRKHDDTPKTSSIFCADHGEELPRSLWNDFDNFILQQIVYSQVAFGEDAPDYDRVYQVFVFVSKFTNDKRNSAHTKEFEKVKRITKSIVEQRKLILSSLQREMEKNWCS